MLHKFLSLFIFAYIFGVIGVNLGFSYVPLIETPIGALSPMAVIVGAIFVLRDFAQRRSGHFILVAMLAATIASYVLADPRVAIASALAFAASEIVDYLVYTFTNKTFGDRIMISSLASTPIDTAVFLLGIGNFTVGTFLLMFVSKMVAATLIWMHYRSKPEDEPYIDATGTEIDIDMGKINWSQVDNGEQRRLFAHY